MANGTDAVRFALMAAGVGPGDAVVTVAHTFIATVEAISQAGATTEFVDIDERTYCMSPQKLADYLESCAIDPATGRPLGKRTGKPIKAIVPVHLYGQVADMDALQTIADDFDLLIVEDACQAQGAEYRSENGGWKRAGSFGKAGAFSFYPGKNLGACGEAGAVTTNDEQVANTIRMLREHGQAKKYYHDLEGYNGRLDAIQAAFLRIKLRRLQTWNDQRRAAAARYRELLAERARRHAAVRAGEQPLGLPPVRGPAPPIATRWPSHLKAAGVSTGLHYPLPVHLQKCYVGWGYQPGDLPITEKAASGDPVAADVPGPDAGTDGPRRRAGPGLRGRSGRTVIHDRQGSTRDTGAA